MKKGDKLICKKKFNTDDIKFEIGKIYTIYDLNSDVVWMDSGTNLEYFFIDDSRFSSKMSHRNYFVDYFITPVELRQLKLESL